MKKIFVYNGSRRINGNTDKFVKHITDKLDKEVFEVEHAHPQDYNIAPCMGCGECFRKAGCVNRDDLEKLQGKILESDVFIAASPVYMHYCTADMKLLIDKSAWWAHTFRLQGKPVVILSTCETNGHDTVIKPFYKFFTCMGGNVIACSNAARFPNQRNNEEWMENTSRDIADRIKKYAFIPHSSNEDIEKIFVNTRALNCDLRDRVNITNIKPENGEYDYWCDTGMIDYETFDEYLNEKYGCEEVLI